MNEKRNGFKASSVLELITCLFTVLELSLKLLKFF